MFGSLQVLNVKGPLQMQKGVINNVLKLMEAGHLGLHGPHAIRIAFNFEDVNVLILLQSMEVGIVKEGQTRI